MKENKKKVVEALTAKHIKTIANLATVKGATGGSVCTVMIEG